MKKFLAAATMAFVLTGFGSTAFAGDGYYIQEKMRQDAEKRFVEYQKEKAAKSNTSVKKETKTKATKKKTEQNQNLVNRFNLTEAKGGR